MALSVKKKSMSHALAYLREGNALGGNSALSSVELAAEALDKENIGAAIAHTYCAASRVQDALCELHMALGAHQEGMRHPKKKRAPRAARSLYTSTSKRKR